MIEELSSAIEKSGCGIIKVTACWLRQAFGEKKLGKKIKRGISKRLKKAGLGHFPHKLPTGHEEVLLFKLDTTQGGMMKANPTFGPSAGDSVKGMPSEPKANGVTGQVGNYAEKIQKIREIVTE